MKELIIKNVEWEIRNEELMMKNVMNEINVMNVIFSALWRRVFCLGS